MQALALFAQALCPLRGLRRQGLALRALWKTVAGGQQFGRPAQLPFQRQHGIQARARARAAGVVFSLAAAQTPVGLRREEARGGKEGVRTSESGGVLAPEKKKRR